VLLSACSTHRPSVSLHMLVCLQETCQLVLRLCFLNAACRAYSSNSNMQVDTGFARNANGLLSAPNGRAATLPARPTPLPQLPPRSVQPPARYATAPPPPAPGQMSPQEVVLALSRLLPVAVQIAVFADGGTIGFWCRHLEDISSAMGGALYRMANHYVAAGCHPAQLRPLLELQARQRGAAAEPAPAARMAPGSKLQRSASHRQRSPA
jgi:hypothetical protein